MYGMIHRGIRQMVVESIGEAEWVAIERQQGIGPAEQISASPYDDAVTVGILGAAADRLGMTLPDLLERYGRYWIRFAERQSFGALLDFTGRDIVSFVRNLDRMHQAVLAALPQARLPTFALLDHAPGTLSVSYRSDRAGLEPFVLGLFRGLLDRFELEGNVWQAHDRSNDSAVFVIEYRD